MSLKKTLNDQNKDSFILGMMTWVTMMVGIIYLMITDPMVSEIDLSFKILSGLFLGLFLFLGIFRGKTIYPNTNFEVKMKIVYKGDFKFNQSMTEIYFIEDFKDDYVLLKKESDNSLKEVSFQNLTEDFKELKAS